MGTTQAEQRNLLMVFCVNRAAWGGSDGRVGGGAAPSVKPQRGKEGERSVPFTRLYYIVSKAMYGED